MHRPSSTRGSPMSQARCTPQRTVPHPDRRPAPAARRAPAGRGRGAGRRASAAARPRSPADAPVAVDGTLERVPDGIVVRGDGRTHRGTAACSRCLAAGRAATIAVHVDELFETAPARGRDLPARRRRDRPRAARPRRAAARAARWRRCAATTARGLLPDVRRRPQHRRRATAPPTSPIPGGRRCGRSSSESRMHEEHRDGRPEAQDEPVGDPVAASRRTGGSRRPRTRCARTAARRSCRTRCAATVAGTAAAR